MLLSGAVAAGAAPRLAFERGDDGVWVANLDGTGARKIASGVDPDISPDGSKVAFNTEEKKSAARHIAVADVTTGAVTVFKDLPSDNSFGPLWAPDGSKMLFYIFLKQEWDIGVIGADGTGFRVLKKAGPNSHSYFSACWMPDGQSLFCQDLDAIYHIGLDGAVIKQWPIQRLFKDGDMDSGVRFRVSPDGGTLLVELNTGADATPKGWDGPAPSIWAMDLATEKTRRVTPAFWWEPCWLGTQEIVCISQGVKEKQPSIYRVSVDGQNRKLVLRNARGPSVSK